MKQQRRYEKANTGNIRRWNREELEDGYLRLHDSLLQTKKELNTKTAELRIISSQLKSSKQNKFAENRDEEGRQTDLEKENSVLKDKVRSLSYKLKAYNQLSSLKVEREKYQPTEVANLPLRPSKICGDSKNGRSTSNYLQQLVRQMEQENKTLKENGSEKDKDFEMEIQMLKNNFLENNKIIIQENLEIIKIQKLLNEKNIESSAMQQKLLMAENEISNFKLNLDTTAKELDQCTEKISQDHIIISQLRQQLLQNAKMDQTGDLHALRNKDSDLNLLRRENDILKIANDRLKINALNAEKSPDTPEIYVELKELQAKLFHLQTAIREEAAIKAALIEKLAEEKKLRENFQKQCLDLEDKILQRQRREEQDDSKLTENFEKNLHLHTFPQAIIEKSDEADDRNTQQLQTSYVELSEELEKTRKMLLIQHHINTEYKIEVENVTSTFYTDKKEFESKKKEYAISLEEKTQKIKVLESKLIEMAHGYKKFRKSPHTKMLPKAKSLETGQESLHMQIYEINLTADGMNALQCKNPLIFLSIEFFDFELQLTPVMQGPKIEVDLSYHFVTTFADLFLYYVETGQVLVHLHQAIAGKFKTWATGCIPLIGFLGGSAECSKVRGTARLLGVEGQYAGFPIANVAFVIQLADSLENCSEELKQRTKALKFLANGSASGLTGEAEFNELHFYIHRARNLQKTATTKEPTAYVAYKFYDFSETLTEVVQRSSNPQFHHHTVFRISRADAKFSSYLKNQALRLYFFDDDVTDGKENFLGCADISLAPLTENKQISGTFEVKDGENQDASVDVSLNWKFSFVESLATSWIEAPALIESSAMIQAEKKVQPKCIESTSENVQALDPPEPNFSTGNEGTQSAQPLEILQQAQTPPVPKRRQWTKPILATEECSKKADEGSLDSKILVQPAEKNVAMDIASKVNVPVIVLKVENLFLPENSPLLSDSTCENFFVEWNFLDLSPEECETPNSLPKPTQPGVKINFRCTQRIVMNEQRLILLKRQLHLKKPVFFQLVTEPTSVDHDGNSSECKEVAWAKLDIGRISETGADMQNEIIEMTNSIDNGTTVAFLQISLAMIDVLRSV